MHSQKKATQKARADWARAVIEGRVIRHEDGRLISYPTITARDSALAEIQASGATAVVVQGVA